MISWVHGSQIADGFRQNATVETVYEYTVQEIVPSTTDADYIANATYDDEVRYVQVTVTPQTNGTKTVVVKTRKGATGEYGTEGVSGTTATLAYSLSRTVPL